MDDRELRGKAIQGAVATMVYMTAEQCVKDDTLRKYGVLPTRKYKAPDTTIGRKARKERARMLTRQREAELAAQRKGAAK